MDKKSSYNTELQLNYESEAEANIISDTCTANETSIEINKSLNRKRTNYLSWDDYFMATAFLVAKRSKDPVTQVGACIVSPDKKIVGTGYNGMPIGCSDDDFPWTKNNPSTLENKYFYVCHAEMNAVLNKNSMDVRNCSIYVALFPCNECAKIIIQSGIKEVVYLSEKNSGKPSIIAAKRMFKASGVKIRHYTPPNQCLVIDFSEINSNMSQMPWTPDKSN